MIHHQMPFRLELPHENRPTLALELFWISAVTAQTVEVPRRRNERLVVELFAEHPDIVTPTGLAVAENGRVFVWRVTRSFVPMTMTDPRLTASSRFAIPTVTAKLMNERCFTKASCMSWISRVFRTRGVPYYRGLAKLEALDPRHMQILRESLFVATRRDIHRLRDTDGDGKADEITPIVKLETEGNYPHNGLSGIAFEFNGRFHFGLGENLGRWYTLVGSDGTQLSGGAKWEHIPCGPTAPACGDCRPASGIPMACASMSRQSFRHR